MSVQSAINITTFLPATLTMPDVTEEQFLALCEQFPDSGLEYSRDSTLIIMPPAELETAKRTALIAHRLFEWAQRDDAGSVVGPNTGFHFRDGSRRSPDAAWFNEAQWQRAQQSGTRYPVFAPEFVIELRSPDDKFRLLQEKMLEYIDNGVQLAWLIDPVKRTVTIYRPNREAEVLSNPTSISGEGPVHGFVLNLDQLF